MKEIKQLALGLIIILAISSIVFGFLYFNQKNDLAATKIKLAKDDSILLKRSAKHTTKEILSLFNSAPINYQHMQDLAVQFHKNFDPTYTTSTPGKIPYGVWVDKELIVDLLNEDDIDGFRIIPMQYKANEMISSQQFAKDQVSFGIVLTHPNSDRTGDPHAEEPEDAVDYNQPCPHPPCR